MKISNQAQFKFNIYNLKYHFFGKLNILSTLVLDCGNYVLTRIITY